MLVLKGWRVVAVTAAILAVVVVAAAIAASDMIAGSRIVIRWTARLSLPLFLAAFAASALARLAPAPWTAALLVRRRYLGLSFALSHFVHLMAILLLAAADPVLFRSLTNPVTIASGTVAYLFIAGLALTSFDTVATRIGRRAWLAVHSIGIWYIFVSFVVAFGKRAILDAAYWPAMALLAAALAVRVAAALCPHSNRSGPPLPAKG